VKDTDWAYLAGLIDGEGSISILAYRRKARKYTIRLNPRLSISNTSKAMMFWVAQKVGVKPQRIKIIHAEELRSRLVKRSYRNLYQIFIDGFTQAKYILQNTLPYLQSKKKHAKILIAFINHRLDKTSRGYNPPIDKMDLDLALQLRKLNGNRSFKGKRLLEKCLEFSTSQQLTTTFSRTAS
jgi:hypothetical protein